jgi:uncharacterized protein (UPF0332 family)
MINKLLNKLQKEGKLKKQKAGITQIERLLRDALMDLKQAKMVICLAERATYMLAYVAMLKAGRALLLFYGYTPDDGAQHKTVVELTSVILGDKYRHLTEQFESMRRKRNEMTYEAGILLTKSEAQIAFSDAIALVKKILSEIKSKNPQLELEFVLADSGENT